MPSSSLFRHGDISIKFIGMNDLFDDGDEDLDGVLLDHFPSKFALFFCTCHNFSPLSSVQIIIIPACCLLCVL